MTNDEIHMIPTLKTKRTTHKADDGLRCSGAPEGLILSASLVAYLVLQTR